MRINIFILTLLLSGCSLFYKINIDNVSALTNDELCIAMGEYKDNGTSVLKLHTEIMKRKNMNFARCHALEVSNRTRDVSVSPTAEPGKLEHIYDDKSGTFKVKDTGPKAGVKIDWGR